MKTSILPPNILSKMSPSDRQSLGKAGRTNAEIEAKNEAKSEKELHTQIRSLCRINEWIVFCGVWGKPSNRTPGEPDFTILLPFGVVLFVEAKAEGGKLTNEQPEMFKQMFHMGHPVHIVRKLPDFTSIPQVQELKDK